MCRCDCRAKWYPYGFSGGSIGGARQIAARGVTQEDMQGRIDLRDEAIFTYR